jgi:DNA replication protein DnaC
VLRERDDGTVVAAPCPCREARITERLLERSGIPAAMRGARLEDFRPAAETRLMLEAAQRYLAEFDEIRRRDTPAKGLALCGTVGAGKTMLACAVACELIRRRVPVAFVATPDLMAELRAAQFSESPRELEEKLARLARTEVCVFDDVAKEKPTEWVQTQYFRIVDARWRHLLPTIITSNYGFDEMAARLGDAVASRLYALTKGRQVYVRAKDWRVAGP